MKKIYSYILAVAIICSITGCSSDSSSAISSGGANWSARKYGGTTEITLKPGKKLEEITWKDDDDLWILTRDMRDGETPEVHTFERKSTFGIMDGEVIIRESVGKNEKK